jgi:CRISPR system Cascade subunit CasC
MLIEFHMLKNYPPVNLNRDETGAPKNCFFGGVQRGRISSQCLKRSWRLSDSFRTLGSFGSRTRLMPELVAERLVEMGVQPEFAEEAAKKLTGIANKDEKANPKGLYTAQIIIYSPEEIEAIAQKLKKILDGKPLNKFKKETLKEIPGLKEGIQAKPISLDIALFGRMVTSEYLADVDASIQVAHAITTHAVNQESDYFTAVDDLLEVRDETGAGMVGDIDFNSCCYYEYASLDTDKLSENLKNADNQDELVRGLLPALVRAMAFSNPSGKQNTFAGHVLPDFILIECKADKIPLSYVNAFEEPVSMWQAEPRIVYNSVRKLADEVAKMDKAYALPVEHRAYFSPRYQEVMLERGERCEGLQQLVDHCASWIA